MGNTNTSSRTSISSVDGAILLEAHGLIVDMLSDTSAMPPHIVRGLRTVAAMLAPPTISPLPPRNRSTRISISLADFNNSESDSEENLIPYLGERTSSITKKGKRNLPQSVIRRMSTSTWTTTTSATGLPTLEPEPSRKRSTSFRSLNQGNLLYVKSSSSVPRGRSYSTTSLPIGVVSKIQNYNRQAESSLQKTVKKLSRQLSKGKPLEECDAYSEADTPAIAFEKMLALQMAKKPAIPWSSSKAGAFARLNRTSDYDSSNNVSPDGSELTIDDHHRISSSERGKFDRCVPTHACKMTCSHCGANLVRETLLSPENAEQTSVVQDDGARSGQLIHGAGLRWPFVDPPPPLIPPLDSHGLYVIDDVRYDLDLMQRNPLLRRINEWDYPIFELQEKVGDTVLSQISYYVFYETGLLEAFRIPLTEFLLYFHALESGYRSKPYHNRMHAADVLHGVFFLASQPIAGFAQIPVESNDLPLRRFHQLQLRNLGKMNEEEMYGILCSNYPALELMALFTAATMHDFDHPGRTNAFLVSTYAPQAILYNDRSVLENHHAASAWSLFFSKPQYNWLRHLDRAEFKRFRYLVIEFILATDLKRHFEILAEFNAKVNEDDSPGIDWFSEADRLLVLQMTIKLADINGPCKQHDIHLQWTHRIAQEFYEQGDDEQRLGLSISPYMDRENPQLAKLQESFINHLVAPLLSSYGEAGLLPGVWQFVELNETGQKVNDQNRHADNRNVIVVDHFNEDQPFTGGDNKIRKVFCIQTKHLQENYDFWIGQLRESTATKYHRQAEEAENRQSEATSSEDGGDVGGSFHADDLRTLVEDTESEHSELAS